METNINKESGRVASMFNNIAHSYDFVNHLLSFNMDKKWSEIFSNAMFLGMISAFLGYVFWDFSSVFKGEISALIPALVMLSSAVFMVICGALTKVLKARWITDYALPISLVGGMAMAIPITNWLG